MRRALVTALILLAPAGAVAAPSPPAARDALYRKLWAPAAAAPSPQLVERFGGDPAAQRLADELGRRLGVQVLRAERQELDGKPVYRMVVMNPGGDDNGAFAVHTLVVDAATGQLVPQFQNLTSGYRLAPPPDRSPRDNGIATTIRRESFSKP